MKRLFLVLAATALTASLTGACSKGTTTTTNEAQATVAPATSGETTPKKTTKSTEDSPGTTAKRGTSTTKGGSSSTTLPGGISVPSIPDVSVPGGDCTQAIQAYTALFIPLATGASDAELKKVNDSLEQLKADAPDNIKADLDTIENGIKNAGGGLAVGQFLVSPEFTKANQEITQYLTKKCGG